MVESSDSGFSRRFSESLLAYKRDHRCLCTFDVLFVCFLREVARFGFFRLGPIVIDVRLVEEVVEAQLIAAPSTEPDDYIPFSRLLMDEVRRSGGRRMDELHHLLVFMRCGKGVAARVFGELGVTPEQVESYLRSGLGEPASPETWMTPEEVAAYLRVHVQTVRTWIREGKMPARRVVGMRSLRVRATDAARMLRPLDEQD